jgi:hypothetical protein
VSGTPVAFEGEVDPDIVSRSQTDECMSLFAFTPFKEDSHIVTQIAFPLSKVSNSLSSFSTSL